MKNFLRQFVEMVLAIVGFVIYVTPFVLTVFTLIVGTVVIVGLSTVTLWAVLLFIPLFVLLVLEAMLVKYVADEFDM